MGVFRNSWEAYYQQKRKLPTAGQSVPDVSNIGVSKNHPSRNEILRDGTFRLDDYQYYNIKRQIPTGVFVPGITVVVSKVHPSRNPRLRDGTFREPSKQYYQPSRVLPPSQFVPGITVLISRTHPSRNIRLRDGTFRPAWIEYYQPKRTLPTTEFVPGILPIIHPRLKNIWDDKIEYSYYRKKRKLPPTTPTITEAVLLVSKVHPSQNPRLRDGTFDTSPLNQYQHKKVLPPSEFVPGLTILISKVHPSRNLILRDSTFRPPFRDYYRIIRFYLNVPAAPIPPVIPSDIVSSRGVGKGPVPQGPSHTQTKGKPKDRFWLFADEIAKDDDEVLGLISELL